MKINTSAPQSVVSTRIKATLKSVSESVGDLPLQFYGEFEQMGITPAGPLVFNYQGVDGDPETQFDLEVALPIADKDIQRYTGKFITGELKSFKHVSQQYPGPMSEMSAKGYEPLFVSIAVAGLPLSGESREVYTHWVAPESKDNVTEIQIGVAN